MDNSTSGKIEDATPVLNTHQPEAHSTTFEQVNDKMESSVDSKNESSVDSKNESSVDSKNESSVDSKNESPVDNKNESSVDNKNKSSVDSKNESSVDSKNESSVDNKNESSVDSKNASSGDSKMESSVDSKINGQSADKKESVSTDSVHANPDLQNKLQGQTDSVTPSEPTKLGVEPPQSNIAEGGAVPTGKSGEEGEAKTVEPTVSVSNTPAGDHKDSNGKATSDTSVVTSDKPVNAADKPVNTAETPVNTAETPMSTPSEPVAAPATEVVTPVTSPDTAVSLSETPVNSSVVTHTTTESTPTATLVASMNSSVSTTNTPVTTVSLTSSAPTTEINSSVTLPDTKVDCKAEEAAEPMETKDSSEESAGASTQTQKTVEGSTVKKRGRGRPPKSATASTPVEREASRRSVQSYVKPTVNDKKADNMGDDNTEESNDDGTPVLGSLEGPVPIQTGKRNRRKVDRLAENITVALSSTSEKKKLTIPEGTGVKLRDVQAIEEVINKTKAEELKIFHRLLYGSVGKTSSEVKKNIRNFCGWSFSREDAEYKRKQLSVARINLVVLKTWCTMLQLSPAGSKETLTERLLEFLLKPVSISKETKQDAGKRKRASKATKNLQGEDEDNADRSVDEVPDQSDDSLEEPAAKKQKRGRKPAVNPSTTPSSGKSKNSADSAKKPGRRGRKSQHKSKELIQDEDIAGPPTDAVLTKKIKELLKTADLEKVTMKIVRQQLIDMYPEYDLSDKRDFIKTTVKEILGA